MMSPGTRPKTEYEYGKLIIARQMYSANKSAAVCSSMMRQRVGYEKSLKRQEDGSSMNSDVRWSWLPRP